MAKNFIPLRPDDLVSKLPQTDQTALTWFVLSGCSKRDAFFAFSRPDMLASKAKAAVDDYIKQFFASKDAKEYIEAYQRTLDAFLHPAPVKKEQTGSMEERKAKAKAKAMEFAMDLADHIEEAEDPEYVVKLMDKLGMLGGDDEVEEQPRRYLPVTCNECEYRKFVEENCERVEDGTKLEEPTD